MLFLVCAEREREYTQLLDSSLKKKKLERHLYYSIAKSRKQLCGGMGSGEYNNNISVKPSNSIRFGFVLFYFCSSRTRISVKKNEQ